MYVQDFITARRSQRLTQKKYHSSLNSSGFLFVFLLSLLHTLYSFNAYATEQEPVTSSPLVINFSPSSLFFQIHKTDINNGVLGSYLENHLENNFSGSAPSYIEAIDQNSDFWQPLAGHSKAILGNERPHWFRLQLHNPSNQTVNYIFSVRLTRGLYIKSLIIPFSAETTTQKIDLPLSQAPLVMENLFTRKTDETKKGSIDLTFNANEKKIILISLASDNWTIPYFSLKTAAQLTADKNHEEKFWHLINGIFISMIAFIFIGSIISKQSGLLWLPLYSISTLCFLPGYLSYNLQDFGINPEKMHMLNIELCVISLIAFVGILKYIYSKNIFLRRIKHSNLLLALICLLITINFFAPPKVDLLVYASQIFEIIIAIYLSVNAFIRKGNPATIIVGPAKLILMFFILFILYQGSMSVISEHELSTWLASLILIDAVILTIILFLIDRHRREDKLLKLIVSIEKEQKVAAISPLLGKNRHDLRASLSDIIGLSELIIASPLDQEQRKHILDIQQSGRKGLEKINHIFSYKNENAAPLQNQEPFTLSILISECAQYYGYRANELNKEVIVDIAERTPEYWKGNHEQIRQLFMHMLEFYLAETNFNEVRINVSEFSKKSFTIVFSITVDDSPSAITKKINSKLTTAKLIAEKLGGTLSIVEANKTLLITTTILAAPTENQSRHHLDLEMLKNRRIIIIDDSETSCNVIESYLQRWDVLTFKAHNFIDALAIIHHQNNIGQAIDLALIDYVMPNINGIEVSQRLRADTEVPDSLSIIIMSNTASGISPIDTKNSGIKQVLDKPVLAHTLRLVLLEEFYFLKSLQAFKPTEDHSNKINKKLLFVEDNPVSAKIISSMLDRLQINYDHASTSQEALKKATTNDYDIILMDCELPDESGFSATRKIRAFEQSRTPKRSPITIVALTAHDDEKNKQESVDAGMDDYLSKPISLIQLQSLMNKIGD